MLLKKKVWKNKEDEVDALKEEIWGSKEEEEEEEEEEIASNIRFLIKINKIN